jgi:hypothetical protein
MGLSGLRKWAQEYRVSRLCYPQLISLRAPRIYMDLISIIGCNNGIEAAFRPESLERDTRIDT